MLFSGGRSKRFRARLRRRAKRFRRFEWDDDEEDELDVEIGQPADDKEQGPNL